MTTQPDPTIRERLRDDLDVMAEIERLVHSALSGEDTVRRIRALVQPELDTLERRVRAAESVMGAAERLSQAIALRVDWAALDELNRSYSEARSLISGKGAARTVVLESALRLCSDALRIREAKAGKVIASDEYLFAHATLEGLRMAPDLDARIRAKLGSVLPVGPSRSGTAT